MVLTGLTEGIGTLLFGALVGIARSAERCWKSFGYAKLLAVVQPVGLPTSVVGLLAVFLTLICIRGAAQYAREHLGGQ